MTTLVIDIGNTRLSWRFRDDAGGVREGSASHAAIDDAIAEIPAVQSIAISSVQPHHEKQLEQWMASSGAVEPLWIRSGADLPRVVQTESPHLTGADRALCALAWGATGDGQPAVIIDAGSAVTVDAVTASGQLLGGWIAPGWGALAEGLQRWTPSLPDVAELTDSDPQSPWATETGGALRGGVEGSFVGGIRALASRVQRGFEVPVTTVLTGGDCDLLAEGLQPALLRRGLVLDGLELLLNDSRSGGGSTDE